MNRTVEEALHLWGMQGSPYHLVAARENQVFRVNHNGVGYALRLHRPGYRTDDELRSELQWMAAIESGGLHVPKPIASISGTFLNVVNDFQIDMLNWLAGRPLGTTGESLDIADRQSLFRNIGREMAHLHAVSDKWTPPSGFTRCAWDRAGLLGQTPVWDKFWENPTLSVDDRDLLVRVRETANADLVQAESKLDYGLIHADLVRENILVDGEQLQLIDFDDSGYGFRLFDLATTLLKNLQEPDYPVLREALIGGYQSVREIDTAPLDLFLLLRSATYVGWIITRMEEEGSLARNERFLTITRALANEYIEKRI